MDQIAWARRLLTAGLLFMAILLGRLVWMAARIWGTAGGAYAGVGGDIAVVFVAFAVAAGLAGSMARTRVHLERDAATARGARTVAMAAVAAGLVVAAAGWWEGWILLVAGASLACYGLALWLVTRPAEPAQGP